MENIDKELTDAFNTTDGTPSGVLIPERISQGIRRFVETSSPIYNITRRVPWTTKFYEYRKVTALPTAGANAEGVIQDPSNASYGKNLVTMKWISTRGKVTGPALDSTQDMLNLWMEEIDLHSVALVRAIEMMIVAGNAEGKDDAEALEFTGLKGQITRTIEAGTSAEDAPLTLAILDEAIDDGLESPTHIILDKSRGRRIWSLLQAQQRFLDRTEVEGGFKVPVYGDLPIIRMDNEAATKLGNEVLLPNMNRVVMPVLREPTFEKLGKVEEDAEAFYIRMYATLAVEGTDVNHVKIVNVAA